MQVTSRRNTVEVSEDEYPKHGTTKEGLAKLRACFVTVRKLCEIYFIA